MYILPPASQPDIRLSCTRCMVPGFLHSIGNDICMPDL